MGNTWNYVHYGDQAPETYSRRVGFRISDLAVLGCVQMAGVYFVSFTIPGVEVVHCRVWFTAGTWSPHAEGRLNLATMGTCYLHCRRHLLGDNEPPVINSRGGDISRRCTHTHTLWGSDWGSLQGVGSSPQHRSPFSLHSLLGENGEAIVINRLLCYSTQRSCAFWLDV